MNYYQITADIEDFGEEEEEDDPNWLLTSTYSSHRQPTLKSTSTSPSLSSNTHSTEKLNGDSHSTLNRESKSTPPTTNGSSVHSNSNGDHNGGFDKDHSSAFNGVEKNDEIQNSTLNQVVAEQNPSEVKVVLRRPRNQNNGVANNVVKDGGSNRSSYYRFSRLIEGVASYVSARPLHEEDGSFQNNEQNESVNETSQANVRHNDESPSSTDSGFASLNGGNVVNHSQNVEVDPIDEKITELFKSLESVPVSEDFRVVRRRRSHQIPESEDAKNSRSFFQRRKQTVSGYFSDWAKWMTNVEPEFERYERYPG